MALLAASVGIVAKRIYAGMRRVACRLLATPAPFSSRVRPETTRATDESYQFVHRSQLPTYHFQSSLFRLAIPKLEDTCRRYLTAAEAVLPKDDFQRLSRLVKDFERNEGQELQKELIAYDKANPQTSYISATWFDIYLRARVPIPVNYNPFMMYAPDPDDRFNHQLTRATNLVISYGRIKRALESEVLTPEVFHLVPKNANNPWYQRVCKLLPERLSTATSVALFKAYPLDMSQYKSMFNGTRIPRLGKDELYQDLSQKHFVVIRRGRFFAVRLFDDGGNILDPKTVHAQLAAVLKDNRPLDSAASLGSLTTLPRDKWAEIRAKLEQDSSAAAALKSIDGALFVLCLDELDSTDPRRLVQSLLIGDDASNRWFDKSFQLIVDARGQAAINFEHSWGDGLCVKRLLEESFIDTRTNRFVEPETKPDEAKVEEIVFAVPEWLRTEIKSAQVEHGKVLANLDSVALIHQKMTRKTLSKAKISPDSIVQLAIQCASYDIHGKFVPTYESSSTAAFLKGRTEVLRSATPATRAVVLAIEKGAPDVEIRELIVEAAKYHSKLVTEAATGAGFDRHLLGLRVTAERLGRPVPDFYQDPAHQRFNHFVLSTSTVPSVAIGFGGFGPVVPDGFGISYVVNGSMIGVVVTSYKDVHKAEQFTKVLEKAFDRIHRIINTSSSSSS